jgi:hypothetical protein
MPTIVISGNTGADYSGCNDNQIDLLAPTTNNNTATNMASGIWTDAGGVWNSLIAFTGIPSVAGASVSSSTLSIYREGGHWSNPTFTIQLRRLLRNWSLTQSTYNVYSTGNNWSTAGAASSGNDIDSDVSSSLSVASSNGYKNFTGAELDTDCQNFLTGGYNNYGWNVMWSSGSNNPGYHVFTSTNGADGSRPSLSITYTAGAVGNNYYYQLQQM